MLTPKTRSDGPFGGSNALREALNVVTLVGEEGMVLVPTEPTDLMIRIGADVGDIDPDTVRRIYKAMLYASE